MSVSNCEVCGTVGDISFQSGIKNINELENLVCKSIAVIETHFTLICVLSVVFVCYDVEF